RVLETLVDQLLADLAGPGVLPDDRVEDRLAGRLLPDDRGLALVGDADRGQVRGADAALLERALRHSLGLLPDLHGVVLHQARRRIDLLVLGVVRAHHRPLVAEDHEARTCGALVY